MLAIEDGRIGRRWGWLSSSQPTLAGARIYVENTPSGNDYYYAHLRHLVKRPGTRVQAGDVIGYSGAANGVPHLHCTARYGSPASVILGGVLNAPRRWLAAMLPTPSDVPDGWQHDPPVPVEDLILGAAGEANG